MNALAKRCRSESNDDRPRDQRATGPAPVLRVGELPAQAAGASGQPARFVSRASASEKVGGVDGACSAFFSRREPYLRDDTGHGFRLYRALSRAEMRRGRPCTTNGHVPPNAGAIGVTARRDGNQFQSTANVLDVDSGKGPHTAAEQSERGDLSDAHAAGSEPHHFNSNGGRTRLRPVSTERACESTARPASRGGKRAVQSIRIDRRQGLESLITPGEDGHCVSRAYAAADLQLNAGLAERSGIALPRRTSEFDSRGPLQVSPQQGASAHALAVATIPHPLASENPTAKTPSKALEIISPANAGPRRAGCSASPIHSSGDGLGIHQPRSADSRLATKRVERQGRARDRAMCPAVTRSSPLTLGGAV